ncbi:MAG TPA: hypothetical protein VH643_33555 [Gemmataceae bacterium]|jgi:hypothetical protein
MNIHDKGLELTEKEKQKIDAEFQELKECLQEEAKELEHLDQLIVKAKKAEQEVAEKVW